MNLKNHRNYKDTLKPGQAAYSYHKKYGQFADWLGAGRASGRETASRVAGGAIAKAVLDTMNIDVIAFISEIHGIRSNSISYELAKANYRKNELNCPDLEKSKEIVQSSLNYS